MRGDNQNPFSPILTGKICKPSLKKWAGGGLAAPFSPAPVGTEASLDGAISPRCYGKQYWAAAVRPTLPEMIPCPILCLPRPLGRPSPGIRCLAAAVQGGCGHQPAINSFICAEYYRGWCLRSQSARARAPGACQHQITRFGRILLSRPPGPLWWHRYPSMSFQRSLMH